MPAKEEVLRRLSDRGLRNVVSFALSGMMAEQHPDLLLGVPAQGLRAAPTDVYVLPIDS